MKIKRKTKTSCMHNGLRKVRQRHARSARSKTLRLLGPTERRVCGRELSLPESLAIKRNHARVSDRLYHTTPTNVKVEFTTCETACATEHASLTDMYSTTEKAPAERTCHSKDCHARALSLFRSRSCELKGVNPYPLRVCVCSLAAKPLWHTVHDGSHTFFPPFTHTAEMREPVMKQRGSSRTGLAIELVKVYSPRLGLSAGFDADGTLENQMSGGSSLSSRSKCSRRERHISSRELPLMHAPRTASLLLPRSRDPQQLIARTSA